MLIGIVDSVGGNVGGVNAIAIANIISMAIAIVSLTKTIVKAPAIYRVWPEQRRYNLICCGPSQDRPDNKRRKHYQRTHAWVQFMVMDYRIHSPVLAGVIVRRPHPETRHYTVLADTIVWATSYAREAVQNDAITVRPRKMRRPQHHPPDGRPTAPADPL